MQRSTGLPTWKRINVDEIVPRDWELSTMLIVGEVLKREAGAESRLYAAEYSHRYRKSSPYPEP